LELCLEDGMRVAPVPERLTTDPHGGPGFLIGIPQDEPVDGVLLFDAERLPVTRIDGF
jgi:hypothetical protein